MAVLNPPSALPGLARSITNHLLGSRASYTEDRLIALFAPPGISDIQDPTRGVDNTLKAARAIGLLLEDASGVLKVPDAVKIEAKGNAFTRAEFRGVLRRLVLDTKRDGDPWAGETGTRTWTTGARDLSRALSWFLAQDAFGAPLSWTGKDHNSAEDLQSRQLHHLRKEDRPFSNDTRWGAFGRWAMALGLTEPGLELNWRRTGASPRAGCPRGRGADESGTEPHSNLPGRTLSRVADRGRRRSTARLACSSGRRPGSRRA